MLQLALVFVAIALIAAFLGFTGLASVSTGVAQTFFFIFLVLAVLTFLGHGFRRRPYRG